MTLTRGSAGLEDDIFVAQFESCRFPGDQFRHADHLRLAWIYIRNYGSDVAEQRMRQSIQSFARNSGAAHKYHETITIFWMRLVDVAIRMSARSENFWDFVDAHAWLLDKDVVLEFYSRDLLMSDGARQAWVEPDLKPFPVADRTLQSAPLPDASGSRPSPFGSEPVRYWNSSITISGLEPKRRGGPQVPAPLEVKTCRLPRRLRP
jgi:hypothetical protein